MARKKVEKITGRISMDQFRQNLNKSAGRTKIFNLGYDDPTKVKEWLSTGSTLLDCIIVRGKRGGIPVGRITEISGLESTGKSYLAAQVAASAQQQGFDVFYFDSEYGADANFLAKAGCDLDALGYISTENVEALFETIESVLQVSGKENKILFIWDSLAMTPAFADQEGDFNPNSSVSQKARVISKAFQKVIVPLAQANATLLILNQLKDNIGGFNARFPILKDRYMTPGGKSVAYASTIRIWLVKPQSKDSFIYDDKGYKIGSSVRAHIIKSRKGCEGRECRFKILWAADKIGVQDEESWFEIVKTSERVASSGAWNTLKFKDGKTEVKYGKSNWMAKLQDDEFRREVMEILEEELITKFDERSVDASNFYTEEEISEQ